MLLDAVRAAADLDGVMSMSPFAFRPVRRPARRFGGGLVSALALAVALGSASVATSGSAMAASLEEALATAYETNPELEAARRELGAVNEGVAQELSNWRPEVTVQGTGGAERVESEGSSGTSRDETLNPWQASLEVRQPLYRGGQTIAGTDRAENEVYAQRARLRSTEQDVLFRAAQAYMNVWRDQAILELNENNVQVLRRQLEATRDRFEVGEVTRTDVAQAESRLSGAIAARTEAQGNLNASRAVYEEVIGQMPEDLEQPPVPNGLPGALEGAVSQARDNNPQVVAAGFAEQAARDEVRQTAGELLPQADLVGRVTHAEEQQTSLAESDSAEILAQITIPLYQQGAVYSRVREIKQVANQRRLERRASERTVEQQAVSAWEGLQTARAQIESLREQVRAADIALEGVRQENQVGARTVLDVLDAEQELLNAKVDLVGAQRDEIVASYDVLAAVGQLSAGEIGLPVQVYDPVEGYRKVRDKWFGWDLPEESGTEPADPDGALGAGSD